MAENESNVGQFFIKDIKNADAGNQYSSQHLDDTPEWVRPWINIDGQTYKDVRSKDAIIPVLNSAHQVQFTNFNTEFLSADFGVPGQQSVSGDYIIGKPDMNNSGIIDMSDAGYLEAIALGKRKPTKEDLDKLNFYGNGPVDPMTASYMVMDYYAKASVELDLDWFNFINSTAVNKYRDNKWLKYTKQHLRLIMPKYLRRFEVESLNRNFWVIGQTLSGIIAYLAGDSSAYKVLINGILDEITQLWENELYLWVAAAIITQQPKYENIRIIHCYIDDTKETPFLKYDNFDSPGINQNQLKEKLSHYKDEFPNDNLVIVPELRSINYKHNYYAKSYFPYIYYYNRNTGIETVKALITGGQQNVAVDLTKQDWNIGGINIDEETNRYNFVKDWTYPQSEPYYALVRCSVAAEANFNASGDIRLSSLNIIYTDITPNLMEASFSSNTRTYSFIQEEDGYIDLSLTETSDDYIDLSSVSITKGFYQGEVLSYIKPPAIEFKIVKIGDFYPLAYINETQLDVPTKSFTKITMEKSDGLEVYDTQTYGIGAYTMKTTGGTAWQLPVDKTLRFVDYYKYSIGDTNFAIKGYDITYQDLDELSVNYIVYLKKKGQLGNIRQDGIYATKFGTTYWNGDDGSQWSSGIVHALVYYSGKTQTAKVIAPVRMFDGYWTRNTDVFHSRGSQWRRLYLGCNFYVKNNTFTMNNGQLIWYDHWNDIDSGLGHSYPRPNMKMELNGNNLVFSEPVNSWTDETNMAIRVKYQTDDRIFNVSSTTKVIGHQNGDYDNSGPITFTGDYHNVDFTGPEGRGTEDFIID